MRKILFILITLISAINARAVTESQLHGILNRLGGNAQIIMTNDPKVDAATTGYKIFVNSNASRSWTTDEAAWTLGHELGHRHAKGNKLSREFQSDYLGFVLAKQAGYNACKGMQRIKTWGIDPNHPTPKDRYNALARYC